MGLQIMLTKFKLKGSRSFLRTDDEMSSIDKSEAESRRLFQDNREDY